MAGNSKKSLVYKDMINQLNKTTSTDRTLIGSRIEIRQTHEETFWYFQ